MFFQHPLLLAVSLVCSFLSRIALCGWKRTRAGLLSSFVLFLLIVLLNPLLVHEGLTVLFYLNDSPITLEALVRGLAAATMLLAVFGWFSCLNEVLTSDKLILLFGRFAPAVSLLLSMTLRLVPRLKQQYAAIRQAQAGIGMDISSGNLWERLKSALRMLSILITWALENGVDTADSMQARGYALRGKTSSRGQRFSPADGGFAALILLLSIPIFCYTGRFVYYPLLTPLSPVSLLGIAAFFLLGCLPIILQAMEALKWHWLRSKI